MRVRTDYSERTYITAGKVYSVSFDYDGDSTITDDDGDKIIITINGDAPCAHLCGGVWQIVNQDGFDISKHEWGGTVGFVDHGADELSLNCGTGENYVEVFKDDAIAIAKHFKLTAEDLK